MPLEQKKQRQSEARSVEDYETSDSLERALVGTHEIGASEDGGGFGLGTSKL
jgi:hypothetical protein